MLRHDKNYTFHPKGWREIKDLTDNFGYSLDELMDIVRKDKKGRYEFNEDVSQIRALYGHSVDVFPDLQIEVPPASLFHGTSKDCIEGIMREGIKPRSRKYVHLSESVSIAEEVGKRHGNPVVFIVDCKRMYDDGIVFYISGNKSVWLCDEVLPKYLTLMTNRYDYKR